MAMRYFGVLVVCIVLSAGCVQSVTNPITDEFRNGFTIRELGTNLTQEKLPNRYDTAVNEIIASDEFARYREAFDDFATKRGGLTETNSGEMYLLFLIHSSVDDTKAEYFTGDRPATLNIDVQNTTFPNAATMLLVGEIISISYKLKLVDNESGIDLLASETLTPAVNRSAGAGGGLLGVVARGGGTNRHVKDLENMALAVSGQVRAILGEEKIPEPVAKALTIYDEKLPQQSQEVAPVTDVSGTQDLDVEVEASVEASNEIVF